MDQWNPGQYLKFKDERTQPSIDLVSRIKTVHPDTIIDIGCGPGNSTQVLCRKWPEAKVTGLDNSPEMIKKARGNYPGNNWILEDVFNMDTSRSYDVVFSSAVLQWIRDHDSLIKMLHQIISKNGLLAVQVPANNNSPLHLSLTEVSENNKWKKYTAGCKDLFNYRDAVYYYSILNPLFPVIDIWETTYYHILNSHQDLIEWYKGTGMKPFLDKLPDDPMKNEFENEVLDHCKQFYPVQGDGKILFPFKRLFFIAYRSL